eukprot:Seg4002.4 transcript_id=Seg4002.4/GoldUCD/mRNA.D3Y31 product="putative protein C10orf67 mitochondrial" protein_id=Seg4002.4/GoldUCD/D3Y31
MADVQDVHSSVPSQVPVSKPSNEEIALSPTKSMSFGNFEIQSAASSDGFIYSDLRPSLADKLRVGYFSMDRACQTQESDIIDLKETTALLSTLVQDTALVKKNLYYAKLALQADYDEKIERRSLELYNRTNERIAEIEKLHEERVKVVRHSFRTQLADAIRKISMDYHRYYGRKGQQLDMKHQEEIDKLAMLQKQQQEDQDAQQEMLDMMQLQISQGDDEEEEEAESDGVPSISSVELRHLEEIRHLTDTISNLEDQIEEYMALLERAKEEKQRAENNSDELISQIAEEQTLIAHLKRENMEARLAVEIEKQSCRAQLEDQKVELKKGMLKDIEKAKIEAHKVAEKQIHHLQSTAKEKEKEMLEKARLHEEMIAKQKSEKNATSLEQLKKLRKVDKQQKQEIMRLLRELEKCNKNWEMRVTIQQQTMHALRDEMFLRTSLHRQAAKLQHAAITYASDGPAAVSAGVGPTKPPSASRKYQLGSLIGSGVHPGPGGIGPTDKQDLETGTIANAKQSRQSRISSSKYSAPVPSPTPKVVPQGPETEVQ